MPSSRTRVEPSRRAQRYHQRRARSRRRVIVIVGAVFLLIAVVLVVVLTNGGDDPTTTTAPFTGTTLNIVLGDYTITGDLTAPAGEVRLQAINQGGLKHNVGVRRGPISPDILPGKAATVDLGVLAPGTYQLYCDIVDHVEQGMIADLVITETISKTSSTAVATS